MSHALTLTPGTSICHLPRHFPLAHGGALEAPILSYEISGARGAPLVVVQGGISADRHVVSTIHNSKAGWWEPIVGPGRAIDTDRFQVLGVDYLRANSITSRDQALALTYLLDRLGVERAHALVGASYGGMVTLAFAAASPNRVDRIVAISAAHESHPIASAFRSVQRNILQFGMRLGAPAEAVALARSLGMITYRTAEEFAGRFGSEPRFVNNSARFPVEDYLESRGREFTRSFDAETYHCLSLAIDLHRVAPEDIVVPATLVGVGGDALVPMTQMRELHARIAGPSELVEIQSVYGHDAFLKETEAVGRVIERALDVYDATAVSAAEAAR